MPQCWDVNARDFDLMGYKVSLLSSIGTAGLNNVFAFVPSRDAEEWGKLPDTDKAFIRDWLAWTDDHVGRLQKMLPIANLGEPSLDGVGLQDDEGGFHGVSTGLGPNPEADPRPRRIPARPRFRRGGRGR